MLLTQILNKTENYVRTKRKKEHTRSDSQLLKLRKVSVGFHSTLTFQFDLDQPF